GLPRLQPRLDAGGGDGGRSGAERGALVVHGRLRRRHDRAAPEAGLRPGDVDRQPPRRRPAERRRGADVRPARALPSRRAVRGRRHLGLPEPAPVAAARGMWGFRNLLGPSRWQFAGRPGEPLSLVIAVSPDGLRPCVAVADLTPQLRAWLVVSRELGSIEDETPAGAALALQAPSRDAAVALLREG